MSSQVRDTVVARISTSRGHFQHSLAVVVTVAVGVVLLSTVWIVHKFRQPNNRRDPENIPINNNINNQQQQAQQLIDEQINLNEQNMQEIRRLNNEIAIRRQRTLLRKLFQFY
jgi:uncharacterized protein HemX